MSLTEPTANTAPDERCVAAAPPPPPPLPAPNMQTYKEAKEKQDALKSMEEKQFANLPDKLMNTMKREKKPFTYTPLSVGDNGKLDLSQIKSPKIKKRLMTNMQDEEGQDENKTESIDSRLQRNEDKLNLELDPAQVNFQSTTNQSPYFTSSQPSFSPSVQTKPSLIVPLSVLGENDYQNRSNQSALPVSSLNHDYNRPLSPDQKLDKVINEQLNRNSINSTPDVNNNYAPSFYEMDSFRPKLHNGQSKPRKIDIAQELANERNFNCVPSSSSYGETNLNQKNSGQINYNQSPKLWSSNQPILADSYQIPINVQNEVQKHKPQNLSNPQPNYENRTYYSPANKCERSQSQQGNYQIPIINQNRNSEAPVPPQRQQSLNRSDLLQERKIPIQYEEPIQSKSFKILQKLTADIEDEIKRLNMTEQQPNSSAYQRDPLEDKLPPYYGTLNHIEEPRVRSERRIPIQIENSVNCNDYRNTNSNPQYHSKDEQIWLYEKNYHGSGLPSANPSAMSGGTLWTQPERIMQSSAPFRYQGSNIPSRTFKMLQMLTNEDDW